MIQIRPSILQSFLNTLDDMSCVFLDSTCEGGVEISFEVGQKKRSWL